MMKRILSMLLALLMVVSILPAPGYAEDGNASVDSAVLPVSADYSDDVGQYAVLNTAANNESFDISYETPTSAFDNYTAFVYEFSTDILFEIAAAEVVTETYTKKDVETGESTECILSSLWYRVNVVQGDALDELQDGFWILQNYLNEEYAYENPVLILQDPPVADPEPTPTDKADPDTGVVVSATLPAAYNGGDITADFANLSIVGIVEAATPVELFQKYGTYKEESIAEQELTIINDSITLYDSFGTDVYAAQVSGVAGMKVKVFKKIAFATDKFVLYQFAYYGDDPEFSAIARTYQFISAADVADSAQEEEYICAICRKVNCTTEHLYCNVCRKFDCGEPHPQENPYKPVTDPVIPENPQLTPDADVSIVDEEGNPLTDTNGLRLLERTKTSISAWTGLTENVNYQWQICYDAENDLWADIQGQTDKGLLISPAMVNSVIQQTESAAIRCEVTSGDTVQYSASIPVEVVQSYSVMKAMNSSAKTAGKTALAADSTGLTNYSVVINYVFENNEVVADPYTATLAAGSNFSATVKFPTIMGYLPYLNDATDTSTEINLNINNIQADKTYTVTYKPTNVNYTVIHYQQNKDNDGYTISSTEQKQGLTNSTVPEVAKNEEGFYALLYERPEIAADGSTVVEIYYDREYYLMIFNLGEGGYGVDSIYARYDAPVTIGTPAREGYTFNGWSPEVPANVPVGGGRYTAQWTPKDTAKVKIVIWGENPDDEDYSYLATGELMLKPNTEYAYNGTDQLYLYCEKKEHTHDASCLSCGKVEHTQHTEECLGNCTHPKHELACVQNRDYVTLKQADPEQNLNATQNGVYSYTTGSGLSRVEHYYLYLDGTWYCYFGNYTGNKSDWLSISLECNHNHTNSCYSCETHTHTAACYGCGKETHSHNSNCTGTVAGLDSTLWTFVRSETKTVDANGSTVINVRYDRTSFTMTFKKEGYNGDTLGTITDKWGADIKKRFEAISKQNTFFWSASVYGGSPWTSFMDVMPAENRTYYADNQSGTTTITATYLAENLEGTGYETLYTVSFKGSSTITVTKEEFVDIEGFTFNDSKSSHVGDYYNGSNFYYDRHKYAIEFYSPTELLKKTENVPYDSALNSYNWTPDASMAPAKYEPGSVEFEGWYQNPECTGDKYDFTTHTMPVGTKNGDTTLTLYAKWVPVSRTVTFYMDRTAMENDADALATRTTPHGSLIGRVEEPDNGGYKFDGWYYIDETGMEQRFVFETMVVNKDMKVYAKWSSNVLKEYIVYYKIQNTDTQIGKPITSSARAGNTKTFDAKGGTDLYEEYQEGYFPLVRSHSMILDINTPATPGIDENGIEWVEITNADGSKKIVQSFTFEYVQKDAVPYKVYYVAETLKDGEDAANYETITRDGKTYYIIANTYTNGDNRKAVVTEKFATVAGYMPDAYQKRLVVDGSDNAVNEIIFFYSVDTVHAYYKITHYTQNTDGNSWREYTSTEAKGYIGTTYTAESMTIDGFTYDSTVPGTVESGELTADGLELKLYYVRNSYPYEVRYLEQGTGNQLAAPKTGTGLYGAVVSESAIPIANYTAVDPTSQTLTIKIEESQDEAKLNIITFYYKENEATINYVVVGPDGCGTVNPTSETVKVLTGKANGSTASANENYRFVGWYSDQSCTQEVGKDNTYRPSKPVDGPWTNATYYAKFELAVMDLNIVKEGDISRYDEGQSFIFHVTGGPDAIDLDVVINGTGTVTIKDLPVGVYTVTEKTDWSWRYTPYKDDMVEVSQTIDLRDGNNTVTFDNKREKIYWLSGDSSKENQFAVNQS